MTGDGNGDVGGVPGGASGGSSTGPIGGVGDGIPGSGGRYGGSIGMLGCSGSPGETARTSYVSRMKRASVRRVVRRVRAERRVTYVLKVLTLVALAAVILSAIIDFLGRIPGVVVVFVGATFFTYAIYPLVRRLNTRMPLIAAIGIVYLAIGGLITFGVAVIVPALSSDATGLVAQTPMFVKSVQGFVSDPHLPIIAHLPAPIHAWILKLPAQAVAYAQRYAETGVSQMLALVLSFASLAGVVIAVPVISVYLMIEAPNIIDELVARLPTNLQRRSSAIVRDLDRALGGFIRGQLTVGATIGTCITIALLVLHVRYAVLIGVGAGLLDVIPYVGAIVGFVPAVTLALLDDGWQHALIVAAVFAAIFQAEGQFIAPKIVSDSVGLSPLTVIVAILIGGELLGIGGMFLAVPVAAVIRVLVLHLLPRRRLQGQIAPSKAGPKPLDQLTDTQLIPGETEPEKAQRARA